MAVTSATNVASANDPTMTADRQAAAFRGGASRPSGMSEMGSSASQRRSVEDVSAPQATSTTGQTAAVQPTPATTRTEPTPAPAGAIAHTDHSVNTLA